ncbi:hypothetical protein PVAND_004293 [Polypedilum vanderplanki]|uniref:Uncharacterized protein n=1 Tax=Polypedilum vanderplanki TaxID=319348 RepID=A0A9J6BWP8_POLVA|nr:hypothetical protein PVAND_004293 [Polypedilum vanderplanki]
MERRIYIQCNRFRLLVHTPIVKRNKARHELEIMDKRITTNLIRQLDLIIGLRYMVSTNIDVSDGLFNGASGILRFPPNEIKPDDDVNAEMNRLRQNPLVSKYQFLRVVPENVIQIVSHNTQSIRKHITTIVSDQVFSSSHIVTLQESWAIDNESYNIPDFEEISRNRLMNDHEHLERSTSVN